MTNVVSITDVAYEKTRGQEYTARIQAVFDSLAHWRANIALAMSAPDTTQKEFDHLQFEMVEAAKLLRRLDKAGERMSAVREGSAWPTL